MKSPIGIAFACATSLFFAVPSLAAFRCTDHKGNITYQEKPCPSSSASHEIPKEPTRTRKSIEVEYSLRSFAVTQEIITSDSQYKFDSAVKAAKPHSLPTEQDTNNCVERFRNRFKDPRSVYAVESIILEEQKKLYVVVDFSARNGFGGFNRGAIVCSKL